jgi:intron-binding protein aquarius
MTLDFTLSATIRTHLLSFIITAFQSLDSGIVRKECAPLVSISIWHNISTEAKRERRLDKSVQLRKAWRAAAKRYDTADDAVKARLRFERSWLFTLVLDFFNQLSNQKSKAGMSGTFQVILHLLIMIQLIYCTASASLSFSRIFKVNCLLAGM